MGYSPDWQKQSYAKSGSTQKVTQKGNVVRNELFHNAPSRLGLADGGDVTEEQLKKEGLAASNAERESSMAGKSGLEKLTSGFGSLWDRLKAGNVDDKNSDAYYKYGAGRGQIERDKVRDAKAIEDGKANAGPREGDPDQWSSARKPMMGDAASEARVSTPEPKSEPVKPSTESKPEPAKYPTDGVFSNPTKYVGGSSDVEVRPFKEPEPIKGKPLKAPRKNKVESRKAVQTQGDYQPESFIEAATRISKEQRKPRAGAAQNNTSNGRTTDPEVVDKAVRRTGMGNPSDLRDPKYSKNRGKYSK